MVNAYWTKAADGQLITISIGLDHIPVFVKDGGIIPMIPLRLHAPAAGEKYDLEIRRYGKALSTYALYDDDGETFGYEKGHFCWRELRIKSDKKGTLAGSISNAKKR